MWYNFKLIRPFNVKTTDFFRTAHTSFFWGFFFFFTLFIFFLSDRLSFRGEQSNRSISGLGKSHCSPVWCPNSGSPRHFLLDFILFLLCVRFKFYLIVQEFFKKLYSETTPSFPRIELSQSVYLWTIMYIMYMISHIYIMYIIYIYIYIYVYNTYAYIYTRGIQTVLRQIIKKNKILYLWN